MHWPTVIRRIRVRRGLKQAALADVLNVDQSAVSRWERGLAAPNLGAQLRLREMMDRTLAPQGERWLQLIVRNTGKNALLDHNLRIVDVADDALAPMQLDRASVIGQPISMFLGVHADFAAHMRADGFFEGEVGTSTAVGKCIGPTGMRDVYYDVCRLVTAAGDPLMFMSCRAAEADEAAAFRRAHAGGYAVAQLKRLAS